MVPIDVATGKAGAAVNVGDFAKGLTLDHWSNPPRQVVGETVDPPALSFGPSGSTVWVYNTARHVPLTLARTASLPTAHRGRGSTIPSTLGGINVDLTTLQASTPDGRTIVLGPGTVSTYQVWTRSPTGWTTPGVAPLQLCSSQGSCNLSISPDGTELAVSSLSALQIIDLRSPAGSSSGTAVNPGAIPAGDAVVMGPAGQSALSWSPRSLVMIDTVDHVAHKISGVSVGANEAIETVGFDPSGAHFVAVIANKSTDACPCRVVILDAATGNVVGGVALGATALDHIPHDKPVGVTLSDAADVVAVSYDNNGQNLSGSHRCALVTYSVATGQAFQVFDNQAVGLGEHTVSTPAFQPGTDVVALVATQGSAQAVSGLLVDARTGAIVHTLGMASGVVIYLSGSRNDGYALAFSPGGGLLAWNAGGTVVIWDVGSAPATPVQSDVVLTSALLFDPSALALSDNGAVATVGFDSANGGTGVALTGDELGRLLKPLGIARSITPSVGQVQGQMSVAMPTTGEVVAVDADFGSSRFFADTYSASPGPLLSELCAAAGRTLTPSEWQTYFPGDPYEPACPAAAPTRGFAINASPPAARPQAARPRAATQAARPRAARPQAVRPSALRPPTVVRPAVPRKAPAPQRRATEPLNPCSPRAVDTSEATRSPSRPAGGRRSRT